MPIPNTSSWVFMICHRRSWSIQAGLAPTNPQYRGRYTSDQTSRDGTYHQGTVWPWLMGPFITAYIRVNGGSEPLAPRQRSGWRHLKSPVRCRSRPYLGNLGPRCPTSSLRMCCSGVECGGSAASIRRGSEANPAYCAQHAGSNSGPKRDTSGV